MQATYAVHFCLVSREAAANLLPVVDTKFRPKKVVLLAPTGSDEAARRLAVALKGYGIATQIRPVPEKAGFCELHQFLRDCMGDFNNETIALNASTGDRLLLLAAYDVFRERRLPVFYVELHADRIRWLSPREQPAQDLQDRIKLPTFLQAYGHAIVERGEAVPLHDPELAEQLVHNLRLYRDPLRTLNFYAAQAEGKLVSPIMGQDHFEQHRGLGRLLGLFQDCRLLQVDGRALAFPSEAARFYVCGGWFEEYVYGLVQELRRECPIQDLACNLAIRSDTGVENELDVAFLAANHFHAIECKARRFALKASRRDRSEAAQTIYKLEALKNLGGDETHMMLVSYQPLPQHDLLRAAERNIAVVDSRQIMHLRQRLREWIDRTEH